MTAEDDLPSRDVLELTAHYDSDLESEQENPEFPTVWITKSSSNEVKFVK